MPEEAMTLEKCYTFCTAHKSFYFGVRNGRQCWCANTYKANPSGAFVCDVPCAGDTKHCMLDNSCCGGSHSTSVYIMAESHCENSRTPVVGASNNKDLGKATDQLKGVQDQAQKAAEKADEKKEQGRRRRSRRPRRSSRMPRKRRRRA